MPDRTGPDKPRTDRSWTGIRTDHPNQHATRVERWCVPCEENGERQSWLVAVSINPNTADRDIRVVGTLTQFASYDWKRGDSHVSLQRIHGGWAAAGLADWGQAEHDRKQRTSGGGIR